MPHLNVIHENVVYFQKKKKKKGLFSVIFYFFHILDYLAANTAQLLHPKEKIRSNI